MVLKLTDRNVPCIIDTFGSSLQAKEKFTEPPSIVLLKLYRLDHEAIPNSVIIE